MAKLRTKWLSAPGIMPHFMSITTRHIRRNSSSSTIIASRNMEKPLAGFFQALGFSTAGLFFL